MNTAKQYGAVAVFMILLVMMIPVVHATELNLVYDANGNLLYGDGKYREYNSLNQLVRIRDSTNVTILEEYVHDPVQERILVKRIWNATAVAETVYYVDENFVRVVNNSGTYDFVYVKDEAGNLVGQLNPDGSKLYVHADHEGSTSVVTNQSGSVVENTLYSPHGEILSGGSASRFDSEGKEYSSVTGDYDFHFRKMNPSWGIFLQPDTLIQNVYDPQSLNRYMFERGNPQKNVDPDGHIYYYLFAGLGWLARYAVSKLPDVVINAVSDRPSIIDIGKEIYTDINNQDKKLEQQKAEAEQYVKDNPEYEVHFVDAPFYKSDYYETRKKQTPNPLFLPKVFNEANGAAKPSSPEKDKGKSGSSGGQCGVNMSCSSSGSAYGSSNQAERTKTGQAAAAARRAAESART